MPTYSVQLNVNVPGLGNRNVVQPDIVAPDMKAAIDEAKNRIVITPLAAQQTAA